MKYLYSFLEPSLDTLRCLSVLDHDNYRVTRPSTDAPVLDFREIRPPCTQMQKFTYKTAHMDVQTIGIFAEMFPNLISLDISFATYTAFISSAPWTVSSSCNLPFTLLIVHQTPGCVLGITVASPSFNASQAWNRL